jgi:hypothetical protein
MFKKKKWQTWMLPRNAQFSFVVSQVYFRSPKRMSQSDSGTLAGPYKLLHRVLAETTKTRKNNSEGAVPLF